MAEKEIALTIRRQEKRIRKVAFPIYRKHDVGEKHDHIIYTRITEDMTADSIAKRIIWSGETVYELEIEKPYQFDDSPEDYHLGRGMYASSLEEFYSILDELENQLKQVRDPRKVTGSA